MKSLLVIFSLFLLAVSAMAQSTGDVLVYKWNGSNWVQQQVSAAAGNSSVFQINAGGTYTFGTVTNAELVNSAITINGSSVSLGGSVSGLQTTGGTLVLAGFSSITGTVPTATKLATARAINGVNFDGSAAITVTAAAGTLTGTTLASNVVASSLTSAAGGSFGTAAFTPTSAYEVPLTFSASVSRSGNTITLANDSATPGNNKVYGTDGSGTKGWQNGGGGSGTVTATSGALTSGQVVVGNGTTDIKVAPVTIDATTGNYVVNLAYNGTLGVSATNSSGGGGAVAGFVAINNMGTTLLNGVFGSGVGAGLGGLACFTSTAGIVFISDTGGASGGADGFEFRSGGYNASNATLSTSQSGTAISALSSGGIVFSAPTTGLVSNATTANLVASGVPVVVASGSALAQSATVSSVATVTTPNDSTNHFYEISPFTNITSISAGTLTVTTTYTDENNAAKTLTHFPMGLTSSGLTTTGATSFPVSPIWCKSNTAITVVATFTGVSTTFDVRAAITQKQ